MRLYKVTCDVQEGFGVDVTYQTFAGTQADAAKARRALMAEHGVRFQDTTSDEVDVPTDKAGLLAFIDELVA